jgi:large subunit ribosomal protein L34e
MVSGKYKSRTYARKRLVIPGGKNVLRHSLRKPKKAVCAVEGTPLHGVARARPNNLRKLAKTQRVPSRPFAGQLSSSAARREIIKRARARK